MSLITNQSAFDRFMEQVVEPNRKELVRQVWHAKLIRYVFYGVFAFALIGILSFWYRMSMMADDPSAVSHDELLVHFGYVFGGMVTGIITIVVLFIFLSPGDKFKDAVVPALVRHYGDLDYSSVPASIELGPFRTADNKLEGDLIKLDLLPMHSYTRKNDQIWGTYRDQPLFLLDVEAIKRETSTGANGKSKSSSRTVFKGVMGCVLAPSPFNGRYILQQRRSNHREERIRLESPDFEKVFDFFGVDQIEGRRIMTPVRMEEWTAFDKALGPVEASFWFEGDRIWFTVRLRGDFLDSSITKGAADALDQTIKDMATDLEAVLQVVDFILFDEMPPNVA